MINTGPSPKFHDARDILGRSRAAAAGSITTRTSCVMLSSLVVLRFTRLDSRTPSVPHSTNEAEDHHSTSTTPGSTSRHLPSGYAAVNTVWMWAAFLALNISAWTQALTGLDTHGRAHAKRLRRELICIPGRIARHARQVALHLHPSHTDGPLVTAYDRLWSMPTLA